MVRRRPPDDGRVLPLLLVPGLLAGLLAACSPGSPPTRDAGPADAARTPARPGPDGSSSTPEHAGEDGPPPSPATMADPAGWPLAPPSPTPEQLAGDLVLALAARDEGSLARLFVTEEELVELLGEPARREHQAGWARLRSRLAEPLPAAPATSASGATFDGGRRHLLAAGERGFSRAVVLWERPRLRYASVLGEQRIPVELILGLPTGWRLLDL